MIHHTLTSFQIAVFTIASVWILWGKFQKLGWMCAIAFIIWGIYRTAVSPEINFSNDGTLGGLTHVYNSGLGYVGMLGGVATLIGVAIGLIIVLCSICIKACLKKWTKPKLKNHNATDH